MTKTNIIAAIRANRINEAIDALMEVAEPKPIHKPTDLESIFKRWRAKPREHFIVVTLNGNHAPINTHVVSVGLVNRALVHPREVFRPAIIDNAVAVIVAHNHPSGNVNPSDEDRDITQRLVEAGKNLGITVLDHIVLTRRTSYSFLEHGDM